MACASAILFATDRNRPPSDGHVDPRPVSTFWSHLLVPGVHYYHVDAAHLHPGTFPKGGLCRAVEEARRWVADEPHAAACMGARGQAVVRRWLHMDQVYNYMHALHHAIAATQDGVLLQRVVPSSNLFVSPALDACIGAEGGRPALTNAAFECTQRALRTAAARRPTQCAAPSVRVWAC